VLVKLLNLLDCDTATCKDGQECIDLLCSLTEPGRANDPRFDLILMDLEMCVTPFFLDGRRAHRRHLAFRPVLDGLSASRRIREFEATGKLPRPSVPIIAVSGNARSEWTERAQSAGMNGTFTSGVRCDIKVSCFLQASFASRTGRTNYGMFWIAGGVRAWFRVNQQRNIRALGF
jgi:CheY-like chemotaxis protein